MLLKVNVGTNVEPIWQVIDSNNAETLGGASLSQIVQAITEVSEGAVQKQEGKDLSSNDYTNEEKAKLATVEQGANHTNVVDAVDSTSVTDAASSASVKKAYDAAQEAKQAAGAIEEATSLKAGLLSATDKSKLDTISEGANKTIVEDSISSISATNAASANSAKMAYDLAQAAVDAANAAQATADAKADTGSASTTTDGLMTASDKDKLDGIEAGANKTVVEDSVTSASTTNAASASSVKKAYDKAVDVEASVSTMLNGAPEAYDTLKEIGDAITAGDTAHTALVAEVAKKVDKVDGKGLSTNDYTAEEKTKLAGIESGANNYTLPTATASTAGGVTVGTNIAVSSGKISVADATTSVKGVVQLSSSTSSTSTTLAATASAVKAVYDVANAKEAAFDVIDGGTF